MATTITGAKRPSIAMAVVLTLLSVPAANSAVLCVGSDGHVTFEAAVNGSCTDTRENGIPEKVSDVAAPDTCGPCRDISISPEVNARDGKSDSASLLATPSTVRMASGTLGTDATRHDQATPGSSRELDPIRAHLASIVLIR